MSKYPRSKLSTSSPAEAAAGHWQCSTCEGINHRSTQHEAPKESRSKLRGIRPKGNKTSPGTELMLDALKQAVSKTLDRKRRLGQYAVFWKDGRPVFTDGDGPAIDTNAQETPAPYSPDKP